MTRNVPACYALYTLTLATLLLALPGQADQSRQFAPLSDFPHSAPPPAGVPRVRCSAASAHALIGQPFNSENLRQTLLRSGATNYRVVRLGGARDLSLEYGRLNIEVDAGGVIAALNCE